jgi:phosphoribosylformylglycinamidine cyclo-ligase
MSDERGGPSPLTYRAAGVDIRAGDDTVARLRRRLVSHRPEVTAGIGGFYGGFRLADGTTLVAGADGVGTKVLVAAELKRWDTIGVDLVAMSVNDILTAGAEPLFFLDYVAVSALDPEWIATVVAGVDQACAAVGCVLLGGETAEMPGLYAPGHLDLAGFAVGRVIADRVAAPPVAPGQRVVGLASSGLHANGYSLVRKIVAERGLSWDTEIPGSGERLGDAALCPTRLYVKPVLAVIRQHPVAAMAHITGGGLVGNLPRVLNGLGARLDTSRWPRPPIFSALMAWGPVEPDEMAEVFNLGIGYCLVVPPAAVAAVLRTLREMGWAAWDIGEITEEPGVRLE